MRLIILILVVLMMQVLTLLLSRDTGLFQECVAASDSYFGDGSMSECASRYKQQRGYNSTPDQIRGPPIQLPSIARHVLDGNSV